MILKENKFSLITSLIVIFMMSTIFFVSCDKPEENNKAEQTEKIEFPDQEAWDSIVTFSTEGKISARIHYGHMQRFKKRKTIEFDDGIEIDFYDEQGRHTTKLTSDKGKLNEATNDIEAIGNVVVVSDSGITLRTEQLWWDNSIEKVISDKFVTITTVENDTLYGYGFESDQYLENWVIKKISGSGRGLNLDIELSNKKQKLDSTKVETTVSAQDSVTVTKTSSGQDSTTVDSTAAPPDTVKDKTSENK